MKGVGENVRFDFRFEDSGVKLCATRDRMPERTFELHLERGDPAHNISCGFIEFVELHESAGVVVSRVIRKLHETMPLFPPDFPEALFRDALSHWLLFNFAAAITRADAPGAAPPAKDNRSS